MELNDADRCSNAGGENAAFLGTRRVENRLQRKIEREGKIVAIGYSGPEGSLSQ